ncbi:DUF2218 domain-containing protein [Pseudosulfitobacter sp. SM2401]|uniref:DUF2218 domain-containing protein n=1 Tax=Pseudosulfitobacter sp. SM2401 TaxID=3350098 RepID=UPI0036F195AA
MNTFASFKTDGAGRYLAALCAHFGRKVEVEYDINKGWVQFPFGRCEMIADDNKLDLLASAEDQPRLDQVVHILTSHLERFAFRENPTLVWQPPSQ